MLDGKRTHNKCVVNSSKAADTTRNTPARMYNDRVPMAGRGGNTEAYKSIDK